MRELDPLSVSAVAAALMSHGRLPQHAIGRRFDLKLRAPSECRRET
jgi:hypothetical protein